MGSSLLTISKGTWIYENNQTPHTSDNLMRSSIYTGEYTAVAQFVIPQSLRYKRFVSATLIFYTTARGGQETSYGRGCRVSAYKTGDTLDELIWNNMGALGERGDIIEAETIEANAPDSFPRWRYLDITAIFAKNIVDGTYYTVMINAWPGIHGQSVYCGIGNASLTDYETKLSVTYEDVPQLPPAPSYPVGTYVNENTDLLFAWNWEATTGATQAAVQLEYKLKTAESWTTVSLTQTGHTYLLSGGLSQGVYQWRIKGTNDAGEVSDYSSIAEFNVVGQPAAPVIDNVPNKALTTITWTTADQNAFDIQIIDSNNKTVVNDSVASAVASYKPNVFLSGSYTAKVRVRNSTGLVSDWGIANFTIDASGPIAPEMNLYQNGLKNKLVVTGYDANYVWEVGTISNTNGQDLSNEKRLRTRGFYSTANTKIVVDSGWSVYMIYYNASHEFAISAGWLNGNIAIQTQYPYYRIVLKNNSDIDMDVSYGIHVAGRNSGRPIPDNMSFAVIRIEGENGEEKILGTMTDGEFTDSTFSLGIPYKYIVRTWMSGGYTDSTPARICYEKTAIVLETDDDELIIDKSDEEYLPYAEDDTGETAVYNCIGRELPVVEHGAFESIAFKTRLFITNDEKPRLAAIKKKNRIYYRDYSGRAFPVAIQPPISFERWMDNGYMADIQFIRIADTEVVINV